MLTQYDQLKWTLTWKIRYFIGSCFRNSCLTTRKYANSVWLAEINPNPNNPIFRWLLLPTFLFNHPEMCKLSITSRDFEYFKINAKIRYVSGCCFWNPCWIPWKCANWVWPADILNILEYVQKSDISLAVTSEILVYLPGNVQAQYHQPTFWTFQPMYGFPGILQSQFSHPTW